MSHDENATTSGGHQSSLQEHHDLNSSIIGKVRSRVSNILPQTLTKWFSPIKNDEESSDNNRNGSLRRRRDDDVIRESTRRHIDVTDTADNDEDEEDEQEEEILISMPPSKKSKLNTSMDYSSRNPYVPSTSSFVSSTPTSPSRKRHMVSLQRGKDPPQRQQQNESSNVICSNLSEPRLINNNVEDTDVLEVIPEDDEPTWMANRRKISSRRSLKMPSSSTSLRRHAMLGVHSSANDELSQQRSSSVSSQGSNTNQDDDNYTDGKTMVLTNGKAALNVIEQSDRDVGDGGDTGSESGETGSQYSSTLLQKSGRKLSSSRHFEESSGGIPKQTLRPSSAIGNIGLNFYTHLDGKKSLFSNKNSNMTGASKLSALNNSTTSLTSLYRRQSFNTSLYGSTSALSDSRLLNISSPFYNGRTAYGGASAYSRYSQKYNPQAHLPALSRHICQTPTSIRPSSSLSSLSSSSTSLAQPGGSNNTDGAPISTTVKRILELMNQFTTPLTDAKKMANTIKVPHLVDHKKRFNDEDLKQNRAIRLSTPKTPYSRPVRTLSAPLAPPPPTNELQVPTMANLLQMKKLQNNTEKIREIANSSKSNLNNREEYKLPGTVTQNQSVDSDNNNKTNSTTTTLTAISTKHVNKIRNKIAPSTRISAAAKNQAAAEDEMMPPVNLPNIPLPLMKSVPKIDIPISISSQQQQQLNSTKTNAQLTKFVPETSSIETSNAKSVTENKTTPVSYSSNESSISNPTYPLPSSFNKSLAPQPQNISASNVEDCEFKFSKPVIKVNSETTNNLSINVTDSFSNFTFSKPITLNQSQQSSKSVAKIFPQLKTSGSCLDVFKKESSSAATITTKPDSTGFGSIFKKPENQWECPSCMIQNDNSRKNCAACQTVNPTETITTQVTSPVQSIKNTFSDAFRKNYDTWECRVCLIQNKNELKECVACKAIKPGSDSQSTSSTTSTSNLFTVSSSSVPNNNKNTSTTTKTQEIGFKNLINQQSSKWECSSCMTYNEQTQSKCACCEQEKPSNLGKTSTLISLSSTSSSSSSTGFKNILTQQASKWECPACMTHNEQTRSKCACCEQEKPGIKSPSLKSTQNLFGISATSSNASKFTFGFTAAQKEDDLKKGTDNKATSLSTSTVTSSVDEKQTSTATGLFCNNTVSSSSSSTSPFVSFKSISNNKTTTNSSGKDVPDVTSSSFQFGIPKPINQPTTTTTASTSNAEHNSSSGNSKSFIFGFSKPVAAVPSNTETKPAGTSGFKFDTTSQTEENKSDTSQTLAATTAATTVKPSFSFVATSTETKEPNKPSTFQSSPSLFGNPSFVQKADSTADSKTNFAFGTTNNKTDADNSTTSEKKSSSNSSPAFALPASKTSTQKGEITKPSMPLLFGITTTTTNNSSSNTTIQATSTTTLTSGGFAFSKPSITSGTSIFGAAASTPLTCTAITTSNNTNTTLNIPTFGTAASTSENPFTQKTTTGSTIFGGIPSSSSSSVATTTPAAVLFGSTSNLSSPQQQQQSSNIFGNKNFSASNSNNNTNNNNSDNQSSNLLTFAAAAKNDNTTTQLVFDNVSSTTSKPFTFASGNVIPSGTAAASTAVLPLTTTASSTPFVFGSAASTATAAIPSTQKSDTPTIFGSFNTAAGNSSITPSLFTSPTQPQQSKLPTFGQPTTSPFNSNSAGPNSIGTPTGSTTLTFGSGGSSAASSGATLSAFGSGAGFGNNNNTFGSGTAIPTFGSSSFGSSTSSSNKPDTPRGFNFSAPTQSASTGVFTFGAGSSTNNNQQQQPTSGGFNFSASTSRSFNFGSQEAANPSQPFQFGAVPPKPTFNFNSGIETASNAPFQFSASGVNSTNIFAPTPTPGTSSQTARRKMRTVRRTTQPR